MILVNIVCVALGCFCSLLGLVGLFVTDKKNRDWKNAALAMFFFLLAAICFYAAYIGAV